MLLINKNKKALDIIYMTIVILPRLCSVHVTMQCIFNLGIFYCVLELGIIM